MNILKIDDQNLIEKVIEVLSNGGLIIFPTETAYGVGVDATNSEAVSKLLEYKKRPEGKAISIAVDSEEMAEHYVDINKTAKNLYKNFLPGPLTVISKSKHIADLRLESEKETLGIRIPAYKLITDIIHVFGKPITSTSANSAGKKTPYSVQDILGNISDKQKDLVDLIIDAGELPHNPTSTVIDTTTEELTIHRQGRIDPTRISKVENRNSKSEQETIQLGEEIMKANINKLPEKPVVFLLNGELGSGKTHFTKGIAKALGIDRVIKSPTYTYVNEYNIPESKVPGPKLLHFDAWRIQSEDDLKALRFPEWFKPGNVIVIEWPSVIMNLDEKFFEHHDYIYIDFLTEKADDRIIRVYSF